MGAKSGGDARVSIHLLLSAGRKAESEGLGKVTLAHVKAVQSSAVSSASTPAERKSGDLEAMDQKVLSLIAKAGDAGLDAGDLYRLLKVNESEQRTLRNHLTILERGGLILGEEVG